MIKSLLTIIQKNFKTLGRSKFSLIAIILVPLLVILITGFAFNSSWLSGINIGVYSDSYSNLTTEILFSLENQSFIINKINSEQDCLNSIKRNENQICIIFPGNLSKQGNSDEVRFYVDNSRINLAYSLVHEINSKISTTSSSIGQSLAQELISSLNSTKTSLSSQNFELEKLKSGVQLIVANSENNLSFVKIENASSYLILTQNLTSNLTNSTSISTNINETLKILSELNSTLLSASNKLNYLKNQSQNIKILLDGVSNKFNLMSAEVNKVNIVNAENIASPIKIKIESININSSNKSYFTPTILSLIALFGSILLSSTFVLQERKSKAYFRNFITPTSDLTFLLGNYLTCLIILIAQFILVWIGITFILDVSVLSVLSSISLVLFLSLSAFIFVGMFIGYLFKSEETTIFAGVLIATLMMFFSNVLLPIETISGQFKKIALFNPLVACDSALKKIILFDLGISKILTEIYILIGFFVAFAILSYLGRRITKRML